MAVIKIVETCTYALPPILLFTSLGVQHEHEKVHIAWRDVCI